MAALPPVQVQRKISRCFFQPLEKFGEITHPNFLGGEPQVATWVQSPHLQKTRGVRNHQLPSVNAGFFPPFPWQLKEGGLDARSGDEGPSQQRSQGLESSRSNKSADSPFLAHLLDDLWTWCEAQHHGLMDSFPGLQILCGLSGEREKMECRSCHLLAHPWDFKRSLNHWPKMVNHLVHIKVGGLPREEEGV